MRRVLVIDDEEDLRELARISLAQVGGMEVTTAASGAEGLEIARAQMPDVVVVDANMPGMGGEAVLGELKGSDDTAGIPVVFLTGSVQQEDTDRFKDLGAQAVLAKPFDPMKLAGQLSDALGWS